MSDQFRPLCPAKDYAFTIGDDTDPALRQVLLLQQAAQSFWGDGQSEHDRTSRALYPIGYGHKRLLHDRTRNRSGYVDVLGAKDMIQPVVVIGARQSCGGV